jgi:lipopolysaccharide export system ATP-binding protein
MSADDPRPARPADAPGTDPADGLVAQGIERYYGRWRVVDDVTFHVRRGEVVGLLGPNGAGKTTSFYMIVGLLRPSRGRILLEGRDITGEPVYRRARLGLGYLAQEPSIFRRLTVSDNVMAVLETMPLSKADRLARLHQLLEDLNLTHLAGRMAHKLSGGERRRVEITRALARQPSYMLLDAPVVGIAPIAVTEIQDIVGRLRQRVSACSSPTTTCARRCASPTAPTSCTRAASCCRGRPRNWPGTRGQGRSTWVRSSASDRGPRPTESTTPWK